jgi:hypothetical protein
MHGAVKPSGDKPSGPEILPSFCGVGRDQPVTGTCGPCQAERNRSACAYDSRLLCLRPWTPL